MFTEGLDDKAICWVKQGSEVAQNPGSPMIEKCPLGSISNTPLMHKNSTFLSPKVLPPVKFHSGFLGLEPRTYAEDSEDESVSVASVSGGHHAYYSDTFEEDGWESSDASFSVRRTNQCLEEENIARFESATVSSRGFRNIYCNLVAMYEGNVQNVNKVNLGHGRIPVSLLVSEAQGGHAVETIIYDLVVEASMRANNFSSKNLRIHGLWEWLLDEFAEYYGVTPAYKNLRYLSHVMNIAVPAKECKFESGIEEEEMSMVARIEVLEENLRGMNEEELELSKVDGVGSIGSEKIAAMKRCRRHFADSDEFMSSNFDATEPIAISTAYSKMKTLCVNISNEIQADMKIQSYNILPTCIDLPNIAASVYSIQLRLRLENFLSVFPPSRPAPHVTELLITTSDFERDLNSWNISSINGGLVSRDLFHNYIEVWIEDTRYHLVGICKSEKILCTGTIHVTSPFVENMYDHIRESLNEYKVVINRWPQYLLSIESAVTHVERAIVKSLEKQYNDFLIPLKDGVSKKIEKHVHKLTRRHSVSTYTVPKELGIFLNTMKRIVDVHHCKVEDALKSAASFLILSNGKENFGDRMSGFAIMSRTKYKNYKQSIIKMLVNNTEANRSTRFKRILEETKEAKAEAEIRERMQVLCMQLTDSIRCLHHVFTSKIFVELCRGFWDKMGQLIVNVFSCLFSNTNRFLILCLIFFFCFWVLTWRL
ncbi:hypothetical protein HPP92_003449 [Vanilla planifolia]|uniref:Uncharacterized protein n=1 Tax=Vanilla planifolia TaxID=51239 RepID=A0A835VLH9_VANPL|nr:hypothetical protein HPP92_003449 [Vanilla planifolia]